MNDQRPTPERILQVSTGAWAVSILAAGAVHSVFTRVEAGVDTVEALARDRGISPRGAAALLDGLVGLGFLTISNGKYRNSPDASEFLVEGKPAYFGGFPKTLLGELPDWSKLPDVVKSGVPEMNQTADLPENPFWEDLVPAIAVLAMPLVHAAAERLKLAEAGPISFLDVGGGSGIYSAIWLGINRQARSTQIDWANVNRIAREIVARHGGAERFRTVDGDFHKVDFGNAEHDVGVYSHLAHQESPQTNVAMFRKFRKALKPGGTLLIVDFVVDDDRSGPPFSLIFRSEMLMRTKEGGTWTRRDYTSWLREAGFLKVHFEPTGTPATQVYAT